MSPNLTNGDGEDQDYEVQWASGELQRLEEKFNVLLTIKDLDYVLAEKVEKKLETTFDKDNAKVYAYILLSMDPQTAITRCRGDGRKAWKTLLEMFERKDKLQVASLRA